MVFKESVDVIDITSVPGGGAAVYTTIDCRTPGELRHFIVQQTSGTLGGFVATLYSRDPANSDPTELGYAANNAGNRALSMKPFTLASVTVAALADEGSVFLDPERIFENQSDVDDATTLNSKSVLYVGIVPANTGNYVVVVGRVEQGSVGN